MRNVARARTVLLVSWLLALCAVSGLALARGRAWLRDGLPANVGMCQGLPRYGAMAEFADSSQRITFAVDADLPRLVERQFCAQYHLAPAVLSMRNKVDPDALLEDLQKGPVLIDAGSFVSMDSSTQTTIRYVTSTGRAVLKEQTSEGLVLLTSP